MIFNAEIYLKWQVFGYNLLGESTTCKKRKLRIFRILFLKNVEKKLFFEQ